MIRLLDVEVDASTSASRMSELFDMHGLVVVRQLIAMDEIDRFRQAIIAMIKAALGAHNAPPETPDDLDGIYRQLRAVDPDAALALKGLGKDLVEYHRFLANDGLGRVVGALVGSKDFQINYDQCLFRLDRPKEAEFAFTWHQDYPYNLLSRNAVTVWAPLTPITADVGPMRVVPGSHARFYPVTIGSESGKKSFTKHNTIQLADHDRLAVEFEAEGIDVVDIFPGDVVLMHSLLMHRSGDNRSDRCRWVFNPRYGNLLDGQMVQRHWTTARHKSLFLVEEIHPDSVVREPVPG
jgi:ectoine hydroxylase-related dioxygenase (phytanoyl-CoA dioxygenase family)